MTSAGRDNDQRNARSAARLAAVQGLYQMDMAGTDLNVVIRDLNANPNLETADGEVPAEPMRVDATFMAELLRGVVECQREIDPMIDGQLAAGWRLARVDSILRAILRSGVFELLRRDEVPARVVINEYIDIAHAFLGDDEPRVVNGVLDKLARRLRPAEFERA
jgi:N utilization substance protein B